MIEAVVVVKSPLWHTTGRDDWKTVLATPNIPPAEVNALKPKPGPPETLAIFHRFAQTALGFREGIERHISLHPLFSRC